MIVRIEIDRRLRHVRRAHVFPRKLEQPEQRRTALGGRVLVRREAWLELERLARQLEFGQRRGVAVRVDVDARAGAAGVNHDHVLELAAEEEAKTGAAACSQYNRINKIIQTASAQWNGDRCMLKQQKTDQFKMSQQNVGIVQYTAYLRARGRAFHRPCGRGRHQRRRRRVRLVAARKGQRRKVAAERDAGEQRERDDRYRGARHQHRVVALNFFGLIERESRIAINMKKQCPWCAARARTHGVRRAEARLQTDRTRRQPSVPSR